MSKGKRGCYFINNVILNPIVMYILATDFFEKDDKYVFKAINLCCE